MRFIVHARQARVKLWQERFAVGGTGMGTVHKRNPDQNQYLHLACLNLVWPLFCWRMLSEVVLRFARLTLNTGLIRNL
jgi:hypothetical protein